MTPMPTPGVHSYLQNADVWFPVAFGAGDVMLSSAVPVNSTQGVSVARMVAGETDGGLVPDEAFLLFTEEACASDVCRATSLC
jgi:hypothetical protein